jgi:hypothetical protein
MKPAIPETVRAKLSKAGKVRASQITRAERVRFGKKAWETQLANARAKERKKI